MDSQRAIVFEGDLIQIVPDGRKRKEKQRHVILFSDQLAICNATHKRSQTKYAVLEKLPLKPITLEEKASQEEKTTKPKKPSKKQKEEDNTFVLKYNESQVELRTPSLEEKEMWVAKIRGAVGSVDEQKFNFRSSPKVRGPTFSF